jgi:hypothetical protein
MWAAWKSMQNGPEGPILFRNGLNVNADGTFEIPNVLPGSYQIFFTGPEGKQHIASSKFHTANEEAGKKPEPLDVGEIKVRN